MENELNLLKLERYKLTEKINHPHHFVLKQFLHLEDLVDIQYTNTVKYYFCDNRVICQLSQPLNIDSTSSITR